MQRCSALRLTCDEALPEGGLVAGEQDVRRGGQREGVVHLEWVRHERVRRRGHDVPPVQHARHDVQPILRV